MERKLDKIAAQVETFLREAKGTQTSLQLIKMTSMIEEGRQIIQQLDMNLKTTSKPNAAQLKKKITELTTTFKKQERQLQEIKDKVILRGGETSSYLSNEDDDSDEESKDDTSGFISGRRGNANSYRQRGGLSNAEKALSKGYEVSAMARNAMVNLRGQRDTLLDSLGSLRDMSTDLIRTEQTTKELTMRRFASIVILYLLAICLAIAIIHVLYWKISARLPSF